MSSFVKVGKSYMFRTITMIQVGKVEDINDREFLLTDASWVADTGRFNNALVTGELEEVEPFPDGCIVSREAIVDIALWNHHLPRHVK